LEKYYGININSWYIIFLEPSKTITIREVTMIKYLPKVLLLVLSYVIAGLIIYMALTNTGFFKKRLENKLSSVSFEVKKNITKVLDSVYSIVNKLSSDPTIRLIFFQTEVGGNKREYIAYLSKLRSSISYTYKVVLLDKDGNFLVSSDYVDTEFKEFELAKKLMGTNEHIFFGSGEVIYSIKKVYDSSGIFLGYLALGMYKDLFLRSSPNSIKDVRFIQDAILINSDLESLTKLKDIKKISKDSLLISHKIDKYNLSLLFFKRANELDLLNIITLFLALLFALTITIWFIVSIFAYNRAKYVEEIQSAISSENENLFEESYSSIKIDEKKREELKKLAEELTSEDENKYKFEEIETNLAYVGGDLMERDIATVDEVFEYIMQKLKVKKVMYMRRTEDGFIQNKSVGFNTSGFYITFNDKIWGKFLSLGKAVIVKGNIRDLYELGDRFSEDLFEIMVFPVVDSFGDVRHLFVAGRTWDEAEATVEDKKEIATRIKNLFIEV
jgi:sensor domain CHASE-containing protein